MQATDYYPFGKSFENNDVPKNRYLYNGKELQDQVIGGTPFGWYDYGARMYDPQIGRWTTPDPLAEFDYDWTPYRYGYNNPISFTDPDGLWEFQVVGNKDDGYKVVLNWQEGDNLETLAKQTGYSVDEIKGFYNESTIKGLEAGNEMSLLEFGGMLEGINSALNESNTLQCNCWGTALEYGETGKVDPKGGVKMPAEADFRLQKNF